MTYRSLQAQHHYVMRYDKRVNSALDVCSQVRMYIALDQSPLQLSAFKLHDMMTSSERLTHALTVHYLSAAILGAGRSMYEGWVGQHISTSSALTSKEIEALYFHDSCLVTAACTHTGSFVI